MKKILLSIAFGLLATTANAALITRTYTYTSGNTITANENNTNENTLYTEINGNLNNANILDGGIATADLADGSVTNAKITGPINQSSGTLTTFYATTATITNQIGVVDASTANAGNIGEYKQAVILDGSGITFPTSGQLNDVTSLTLTPGDWDVTGMIVADNNGTATITRVDIGISFTSGNSTTGLITGTNRLIMQSGAGVGSIISLTLPDYRVSLAATTIVYLKQLVTYTSAAGVTIGRISARRVR